jgi:hypothetical protein
VVNGAPTSYTLDFNTGLTQVLTDGANKYLYGNGRIGEEQAGGWQYYLLDALGSVRQLLDGEHQITASCAFGNYPMKMKLEVVFALILFRRFDFLINAVRPGLELFQSPVLKLYYAALWP